MIRVLKQRMLTTVIVDNHTENIDYFIFVGNSSDVMPVIRYNESLIANGSKFIIVGGSTYLYDEENIQWVIDRDNSQGGGGGGISNDFLEALINCFEHVSFIDDNGEEYLELLRSSSNIYLVSISANYTQSQTIYKNDNLDLLIPDLVVTGTFSDNSTSTISSSRYTLSGELSDAESIITVTSSNVTTTFTVTVSQEEIITPLYNWDFTSSLVDTVSGFVATTNKGTLDENGITFSESGTYIAFNQAFSKNRTYEIDVKEIRKQDNTYGRLFMIDTDAFTAQGGAGLVLTGAKKHGDYLYYNGAWQEKILTDNDDLYGEYFDNSTVGFYFDEYGYLFVYKDGQLIGQSLSTFNNADGQNVYIGSTSTSYSSDDLEMATFTGFRIYEGFIY